MTILPRIKHYEKTEGLFIVGDRVGIRGDAHDTALGVNLLKEYFYPFGIAVTNTVNGACVTAEKIKAAPEGMIEYYELQIESDLVTVRYTDELSFRDAAATLIALLQSENGAFYAENCTAKDYADYRYRGFMLDLARKYVSRSEIREKIVLLSKAKYTVLHLHLLDTERYAIVSEAVPELNERPIFRQYTKEEMREIVAFAAGLGVAVIPEIDLPGHGLFLLDRLPRVRCEKNGEKIGVWDMCVASEETYRVVDLLVKELTEIFPCDYIHLGGDELSFYDMKDSGYWPNWYECDRCKALAEKEGYTSASDYYCHFVRRVYDIVAKHGKKLMIWNDSIDISRSPDLPRDILIHFWRVAMDTRGPHKGCSMQRFLEEGFRVVNSFYEEVYADDYIREEALAKWTPSNDPQCEEKYRGNIVGGEICAWGIRNHFDYTLPVNLMLFGDRLWNDGAFDREEVRKSLTRQLVCNEKDFVNVFDLFGGAVLPLDGEKKYCSKENASEESVREAIEKVTRKHAEGRYDGAFLRSIINCLEELRNDLK